ncbi:hypothetical protein [uncultured Oscillibacter sp.]|uniref:hypothetical protein n=1 Tax=uncultured Oscillibacter sp. TaxID=876091 RepID=UPI0025E3326A|nr:hypothetical protein [uncultured Oscillibacter sp.]
MGNELLTGFLAGQSDNNSGNNGGGFFGNEGLWAVIILAIIFGWGNNGNGFGSRNGGGNGGDNVTVVPYPAPSCYGGYPTEAVLQRALDTQTIISKLDGNTQGLCDGFYAQSNAINGLGTTIMQTASQAELARCQQQAALMQQLYNQSFQNQQCCCETQRLIERTSCDAAYAAATNAANIIQNAHNDTDRVLARLDAIESSRKDQKIAEQAAEIQAYRQNATFSAMLDANTAEILRRSGHDCPSAAYIVQPPTPVNFPTNGCGQFSGWNNGCDCGGNRCC